MKTPQQLAYPVEMSFIEPGTGRRYKAEAIPLGELPDIETDIGACCHLGDNAHPRYKVDGIERPDFDPTIPADLLANDWYWHGGWFVQRPAPNGAGIVVGMPKASLDEIWTIARKIGHIQVEHREARAAHQLKANARAKVKADKAASAAAKLTAKAKATPTIVAPAVVVVGKLPAAEQLALF